MFGAARCQALLVVDAPSSWVTEWLKHHNQSTLCTRAARFKPTPQLLVVLCSCIVIIPVSVSSATLVHDAFLTCGLLVLRLARGLVASPPHNPDVVAQPPVYLQALKRNFLQDGYSCLVAIGIIPLQS